MFQLPQSAAQVRSGHSQVVDFIGRAIVSGEFAEESILPHDVDLSKRFSVSRTVVREAMKTLAAKGLVAARTRVGTWVTDRENWNLFDNQVLSWHVQDKIDEALIQSLTEIRLALEPYGAMLAAERASETEIEELRQLAEAMGNPDHTPESMALADLEFHLAITAASRNPFMRRVNDVIEAALFSVFKLSSPTHDAGLVKEIARSHMDIVEAIAARDKDRARAAMENVIDVGIARVRSAAPAGS